MGNAQDLPLFLRGITIQGFKSFADRVKIEIGPGLSVIVGPNGSGKSNIADAVRWVLGEQSVKHLRGSKMEDVIFAGSSHRRQVGMAEVSLVFDNTSGIFPLDYREVTITRRVYRDGEGEYFINRVSCRLKDIQELFLDTGAGKEGFSIIGQGRVEEILNSRPEERRLLIEEASGISKYRVRKKEALKRLEDTEHNLERLGDILREIEGQLGPLAEQARIAEQSMALAEEQRRLEIQVIVNDLQAALDKLESSRRDQESWQEALARAAAEAGRLEAAGVEQNLLVKRLEEDIQVLVEQVHRKEQDANNAAHEAKLRQERQRHQEEQVLRLERESVEGEEKQVLLAERIQALQERLVILQATVREAKAKLAAEERALQEVRSGNDVAELERWKTDLFNALAEQAAATNDLTGLRHNLAALEQQLELAHQEQERLEEERVALAKIRAAEEDELASLAATERAEARLAEELAGQRQALEERRQRAEAAAASCRRRMEQLRAKAQALQALEDSLEGYQRGVREIMAAHKRHIKAAAGLHGTIADLLTVPRDYEVAIETALGAALQNVVTETEADAKAAINYLKAGQLGRATFLPLETIRGGKTALSQAVQEVPGFIGLAADLVQYVPRYRHVMEFLLGRILVVRDLEAATAVARLTGYKQRVVTLEGDQVNAGGSLTGGSLHRQGASLLGRTREIAELDAEIKELERKLAGISEEQEALGAVKAGLDQQLAELAKNGQERRERSAALAADREHRRLQAERLDSALEVLLLKVANLAHERDELVGNTAAADARLERSEQEVAAAREALAAKEEAVKTAAGVIDSLTESLMQEKVRLAKLEQEQAQVADMLGREQEVWREQAQMLARKKESLAALVKDLEANRGEHAAWSEQATTRELELAALQRELVRLRQDRETAGTILTDVEGQLRAQQRQVQDLEQKLHACELSRVRWEAEWEAGLNRLTQEYAITWEEALPFRNNSSRAALWQRLQDIRQAIEELGPVNEAAREEYPKLVERHRFLLGQREDLTAASVKLRELVAELDKTMSERFSKGFRAVNEAFRDVFRELFSGGQAELRLIQPDNLLETGFEIVAQPPGKKAQLLSLLSGGERALTAIALLFALLRVKPSPFCILDEIEASLDDANVQRFANYLQRLSASTQFLVISHRKGTMAAADVLYGVTMEESGVSKLLAVTMDDVPVNRGAAAEA